MKNNNPYIIILIFVVLAAAGIGLYVKYRVAPIIDLSVLHLYDLDGKPVDLAEYKGRTLFVNFFATWCGPCNKEIPDLEKMKQALQNDKIVFLAISDEDPELLKRFIKRTGSSFIFLRSSEKRAKLMSTIPTTYIISAEGREMFHAIGSEEWTRPEMTEKVRRMTRDQLSPTP